MGKHILIQPASHQEPYYLLADDLNRCLLEAHHQHPVGKWRPGRMIIETSPGNYQVWIHASCCLSLDEKRYWLRKMKSDPGADPHHRWGRCPGFFNKKEKHRSTSGLFPLSKLIWVDWRNTAHIPKTAKRDPKRCDHLMLLEARHHTRIPRRTDYERHNESVTDFTYALALARRQFTKDEIIKRLLEERNDWTNHEGILRKHHYLDRTVSKAIAIINSDPRN